MANILQRGLANINQTVRAVRTGEGDSNAAKLGKAAKKGLKKAKAQIDDLLGLEQIEADTFEAIDPDEPRSQKSRAALLGEDPMVFVPRDGEKRDLAKTIAPEFRGQVTSGLAAANSMTAGSTLVGGGDDSFEG